MQRGGVFSLIPLLLALEAKGDLKAFVIFMVIYVTKQNHILKLNS